MSDLDRYKDLFVSEAVEILTAASNLVVHLGPDDEGLDKAINELFRHMHTLKGMAATMGLANISGFSHRVEDLLAALRDGKIEPSDEVRDTLFTCVDALGEMVSTYNGSLADPDPPYALMESIERLSRKRQRGKKRKRGGTRRRTAPPRKSPQAPAEGGKKDSVESLQKAMMEGVPHSVRVDASTLDRIHALVGELIVLRSRLEQDPQLVETAAIRSFLAGFRRTLSEMHAEVLNLRMFPLSSIFSRYPRMVYDLARRLGKKTDLQVEGEDIGVDKVILTGINEPLMHLVRNAVDHGIEPPEERLRSGKPERGTVLIRASRGETHISIEVRDDGRGIDPDRIRSSAVGSGVVPKEEAEALDEREVMELIFHPGVSTKRDASGEVSGRGVGMDAVRDVVARLGGRVEIRSRAGEGTSVKLTLPLSISIVPAMMLSSGEDIVALPVSAMERVVRLDNLRTVDGIEFLETDEGLVRIVRLSRIFGRGSESLAVIISRAGGPLALGISAVLHQEDIVVRPLDHPFGRSRWFTGATILGDGRIAFVLDVNAI